jgi:prepilin-type N-terminal cleavage/methylation domain-containing protein
MTGRRQPSRAGFVLLEVLLALALFASVATAMTVALSQLAESTTSARREALLLRRLQSELAEVAHAPRLDLGHSESPRDAWGISVSSEIQPLELKSEEERSLSGLYQVRVRAAMTTGREDLVREMETWIIRFEEIQSTQPTPPADGNPAPRAPSSPPPSA